MFIAGMRYAAAAARCRADVTRADGSDPSTVAYWESDAALQESLNEEAVRAAGCVLCTRCNDGDVTGAHRVGKRTFLQAEKAALVHVWQSRREARRFHGPGGPSS